MEDDKKRGKNFTETEKSILIDLILPYKNIIENIKTDGATNKEKDLAWSEIARNNKSDYKVEFYKTGGRRNLSMLSSTTDKVIGILGDRLESLPNQYDIDSDYPNMYYEFYHNDLSDDLFNNSDENPYLIEKPVPKKKRSQEILLEPS
ncbi:myb/SANT-like DNA-binding domain-containing protein 3, partial [Aphis craccivora]